MPTKSNNTGGRGGARPGAGRKKKALPEKIENGSSSGRKLKILDIPDVSGVEMPKPHDFLSSVQCEEMTSTLGYLSKHPTTGKPIPSPFISIGINYMNQANRLWKEIYQIVKENCSTEYSGASPHDDLMERLLSARHERWYL